MATAARASASASASVIEKRMRSAAGTSTVAVDWPAERASREDHLERLAADRLAQDRGTAGGEVALVDVELVGIDGALHDRLAQAIGGRDEHHLVEAGLGIEREHDTGGAQVAADHALDAGRQRDVGVREALVHAIGDRPIVVERRKYFAYRLNNIIYSIDIKKCFLLTGERRIGQILGGRRRADRKRRVRGRRGSSLAYAVANRFFQRRRQRRLHEPAADLRARRRERVDVVDVEALARRSAIRAPGPLWARNSRNADAVVAKPPGTRMPAPASWLIISPSDAFLPPTSSTSVMRSRSNGMTRALSVRHGRGLDGMLMRRGNLGGGAAFYLPAPGAARRCTAEQCAARTKQKRPLRAAVVATGIGVVA